MQTRSKAERVHRARYQGPDSVSECDQRKKNVRKKERENLGGRKASDTGSPGCGGFREKSADRRRCVRGQRDNDVDNNAAVK